MAALLDLSQRLALERDRSALIDGYCASARRLIGSGTAVVGIFDRDKENVWQYSVSGLDESALKSLEWPSRCQGVLKSIVKVRRLRRVTNPGGEGSALGLPPQFSPARSFLGVPILIDDTIYGFLCLTNKLGSPEFSEADEQLAVALAAQLAVAHENSSLYLLSAKQCSDLESEMAQRKNAETRLAFQANILDHVPSSVIATDLTGNVVYWNAGSETMLQWTAEEAEGKNIFGLIIPHTREQAGRSILASILKTGRWQGEFTLARKDGSVFPADVACSLILDDKGTPTAIVGISSDVTESKLAGEALRQAEQKYRGMFENAAEGFYQSSPDGRFIAANQTLACILGYASPDHLMKTLTDGPSLYVQADCRQEFMAILKTEDTVQGFETQMYRRDGAQIWVSESARAVRGSDGALRYYEGALVDITERRQLQDQLQQSQKMEAIGKLAGGIAHDFNNLLTAILGFTQLSLDKLQEGDPVSGLIDEVKKAGERAAALTSRLLTFSRKKINQPLVLDINATISEVRELLVRVIGEHISVSTILTTDLGRVRADPGQIEQVIMNLAVNAKDAMPQGGQLVIETANVVFDKKEAFARPGIQRGGYVVLSITDTGCGMDPDVSSHVFEPFFTTKKKGEGTGLGLSTVYGIVQQSGGHIEVFSKPGEGSTFKVFLPRVHEEIEVVQPVPDYGDLTIGTETILLVEDEPLVRELTATILTEEGYTVVQAADGDEALMLVNDGTAAIDLIVSDVVMPVRGGKALAEEIAKTHPDLRILFYSGYAEDLIVKDGLLESGTLLLEKPFTRRELTMAVRAALNGRGPSSGYDPSLERSA